MSDDPKFILQGLRLRCLADPAVHVDAGPTTPEGRVRKLTLHLEVLPPEGEKDFEASIERCLFENPPLRQAIETGSWTPPLLSVVPDPKQLPR